MRLAKVLGIASLLFGMTGCISSTTVIKIKPDGSGTVVQTTTMNAKMAAQMKEMVAGMSKAMAGDKPPTEKKQEIGDLFTESEARGKAAKMGEGVRFVSSEPIKTSEAEGIRAVYAFDDITKLKVDEKPSAPGPVAAQGMAPGAADSPGMTFRFTKQANGNSLLTVLVPEKKGQAESAPSSKASPQEEPAPEQLAQLKEIFKGMKIGVAVEVQGRLVKTNASYVNNATVTLMEMDFGELIGDTAKLAQMSKIKTMDEAKKALKDLKGFKIDLGPEINIEFTGK